MRRLVVILAVVAGSLGVGARTASALPYLCSMYAHPQSTTAHCQLGDGVFRVAQLCLTPYGQFVQHGYWTFPPGVSGAWCWGQVAPGYRWVEVKPSLWAPNP